MGRAAMRVVGLAVLVLALTGFAVRPASNFEKDRKAILAMVGDYHVSFDVRETVVLVPGYKPIANKVTIGDEIVRVIEDTGRTISLQHILVGEVGGKPYITKHWRQDWTYEPASVLVYAGPGRWVLKPVSAANRAGAWSQTVYQTDDSPRYGGLGRWAYDTASTRWTSDLSSRPLARRDATRRPVYDHYDGVNRQMLTPTGWVHEQDNAKIGMKDGRPVTFVHEVVLNTYVRGSDFKVAVGETYWAKTRDYWAGVRAAWRQALAKSGTLLVAETADEGAITVSLLMDYADQIVDGKITTAQALEKARPFIAANDAARRKINAAAE